MAKRALKSTTPAKAPDAPEQTRDGSRSPAPTAAEDSRLLVSDLGWSEAEALDTHVRLRPFRADWDAPGMDAYDDL